MKKVVILLITILLFCSSLAMADDFKIEKEGSKYKITTYAMVEEADSVKQVKVKAGAMTTTKGNLERFLKEIDQNITKLQSDLVLVQIAKDNIQSRIDIITGIELNEKTE